MQKDWLNRGKTYFERREKEPLKVHYSYLFPNGMVATFDYNGKQIPELQGEFSTELLKQIKDRSDNCTKLI